MRPWQEITYASVGLAERVSTFADDWAIASAQGAAQRDAFEADQWLFDEEPYDFQSPAWTGDPLGGSFP